MMGRKVTSRDPTCFRSSFCSHVASGGCCDAFVFLNKEKKNKDKIDAPFERPVAQLALRWIERQHLYSSSHPLHQQPPPPPRPCCAALPPKPRLRCGKVYGIKANFSPFFSSPFLPTVREVRQRNIARGCFISPQPVLSHSLCTLLLCLILNQSSPTPAPSPFP